MVPTSEHSGEQTSGPFEDETPILPHIAPPPNVLRHVHKGVNSVCDVPFCKQCVLLTMAIYSVDEVLEVRDSVDSKLVKVT